ncbi:acinetodin/klebsidin/J25 family lasso peptide [Pelagibacterium halotolerans]
MKNLKEGQKSSIKIVAVATPAAKATLGGSGPIQETFDLMNKKYG